MVWSFTREVQPHTVIVVFSLHLCMLLYVCMCTCKQAEREVQQKAKDAAQAAKQAAKTKLANELAMVKLCSICTSDECTGFVEDPYAIGTLDTYTYMCAYHISCVDGSFLLLTILHLESISSYSSCSLLAGSLPHSFSGCY